MRKIFIIAWASALLVSCDTKTEQAETKPAKDSLTYAYKAVYSSDITVPGNPVNAQKVLHVLKMFEMPGIFTSRRRSV